MKRYRFTFERGVREAEGMNVAAALLEILVREGQKILWPRFRGERIEINLEWLGKLRGIKEVPGFPASLERVDWAGVRKLMEEQ